MIERVCEVVGEQIQRNERTFVFTNNDEISLQVSQAIGYEADVFQKEKT